MLHSDAKSLKERGDALFAQKRTLDSRNQEIADQFYPERADFTVNRDLGTDFAEHLMTGYPSMVRRDLGNSLGSMLRPKGQNWFHVKAKRDDGLDHESKSWLEWAGETQRKAMYDRMAMFNRATKEGDHDFSAFGGAVIEVQANLRDVALLYRCWHLRDVAWAEDSYGQINQVHRDWRPTVAELKSFFPKARQLHSKILEDKEPGRKVKVRHIVIKADEYGGQRFNHPWVSLYVDCENDHIIEEVGSHTRKYVISRWATISGSQYAYSPASLIALPDARLLQAMTLTVLEAGEKAVSPPMIGVGEAIRGDMNLYAGGFTSIDREYDERLGEVLRPITQDKSGLPFGLDMIDRHGAMLREAFYLNTLSMPPAGGPDMTAYEVGQRVQEYIRNALPLFEPMEDDYNGQLCDMTFETLMHEGTFGPPDTIPEGLRGQDIEFGFESPLAEMVERQKGQKFLEAKAMLAAAAEVDPSVMDIMDFKETLRDVLAGIGSSTKWMRSIEDADRIGSQRQEELQAQQMLATAQQGADVAASLASTAQGFGEAA